MVRSNDGCFFDKGIVLWQACSFAILGGCDLKEITGFLEGSESSEAYCIVMSIC